MEDQYSSDDEEESVVREVTDDTGRWRLLSGKDFNIKSSKDFEDYAMMLRCHLVKTVGHAVLV